MVNISERIKAEKAIVKALAKECFSVGGHNSTLIYVSYDGACTGPDSVACDNPTKVWSAVSECDESHLIVMNQFTGKTLGVFFIVLGNDGFDCIADYGVNEFTTKIDKYVEPVVSRWEQKLN